MKTTLNPFENAKRTAQGTGGGVSPAVIEEMQAEISILGSQNETQAQDITDIKTQLEELAGAYSTTEHKTGKKWIDDKDIYSKTIDVKTLMSNNQNLTVDFVCDVLLTVHGYAKKSNASIQIPYMSGDGASLVSVYYDNANSKLHIQCGGDFTSYNGEAYITLEYTKATL